MSRLSEPLVSVIMSVYNCEKTLKEALDSLIDQTYRNWEAIICNDASTDRTQLILEEYKKKYPQKFVLISNSENKRLSHSLNRCLKLCNGNFIARMDGDDISHKERFEKQVRFLIEHEDIQVVGTAMQQFDRENYYKIVVLPEYPDEKMLIKGTPFCHATIMMRKAAYDAVNGYKESKMTMRSQDYDMWFRFFACGFKGYNMQEPLYYVREDINAIKRRTLSNRYNIMKIQFTGYQLLGFSPIYYLIPIAQFCKAFVPSKIVHFFRKREK